MNPEFKDAYFAPSYQFPYGRIWINPTVKRFGIRQYVALFAHEVTHWYDWIFVFRRNGEKWDKAEESQIEDRADKVQDFVLNLFIF